MGFEMFGRGNATQQLEVAHKAAPGSGERHAFGAMAVLCEQPEGSVCQFPRAGAEAAEIETHGPDLLDLGLGLRGEEIKVEAALVVDVGEGNPRCAQERSGIGEVQHHALDLARDRVGHLKVRSR
ncbi:MAG: hypothetical protein R3D67_20015 [Hyphomicrobiaceae bacterium]